MIVTTAELFFTESTSPIFSTIFLAALFSHVEISFRYEPNTTPTVRLFVAWSAPYFSFGLRRV